LADSIAEKRTRDYLHYSRQVKAARTNPKVLVGLPWKDSWNLAGGKSFTARFIEDAGGDYLWKENLSTEYIPLNLEAVFMKALTADVWINTGTTGSLREIKGFDPRFTDLAAFKNHRVYNNNARQNEWGGNDFWESGTARPDIVLKDLIKIFHPELMKEHSFVYYRQLE
jgi:iron complex transport system substrate-binding protein